VQAKGKFARRNFDALKSWKATKEHDLIDVRGRWPPAVGAANNLLADLGNLLRSNPEGCQVNSPVASPIDQPFLAVKPDIPDLTSLHAQFCTVLDELLEDMARRHGERSAPAIEEKHRALPVCQRGRLGILLRAPQQPSHMFATATMHRPRKIARGYGLPFGVRQRVEPFGAVRHSAV
jgi:hypothetical protein